MFGEIRAELFAANGAGGSALDLAAALVGNRATTSHPLMHRRNRNSNGASQCRDGPEVVASSLDGGSDFHGDTIRRRLTIFKRNCLTCIGHDSLGYA